MWITLLAQLTAPPPGNLTDLLNVTSVTQFGVAGLMGGLWWWERKYSRQREDELTAAHQAILAGREHLQALLDALQGNTKVISDFTTVQEQILHLLQTLPKETPHA